MYSETSLVTSYLNLNQRIVQIVLYLNQLRVPLPEDERLEPGDEPLDARDADGELLGLGQALVVLLVLLQPVQLVRRRDVLQRGDMIFIVICFVLANLRLELAEAIDSIRLN